MGKGLKLAICCLVAGLAIALAVPAYAFHITVKPNGNLSISGTHYNLNIHGVEKGKNPKMTGSERHTIFVGLGNAQSNTTVQSKIYLDQGPDFQVCDGNGVPGGGDDGAYDCSDPPVQIAPAGATFQLPCNLHLPATGGGTTLLPCDGGDTASYEVFMRVLGSPKFDPQVTMTTCATEVVDVNGTGTLTEVCSTENVVLIRNTGKSKWTNVTNALTSLCVDFPVGGNTCDTRYALFRDELEDWNWEYDNQGVRLAQLRFYLLP